MYVCLEGEVASDLSEVMARIGVLEYPLEEVGVWCQDHYRGQSGGRRPIRYDQIPVREMPLPDSSVRDKAQYADAFVRGLSYEERLRRRMQLTATAKQFGPRSASEIDLERLVLRDANAVQRSDWEWESRAVVCDSYVVSFADHKKRLIIEVDEPRKNRALALAGDRVRDAHLHLAGYEVLHLWDAYIIAAAKEPSLLVELRDLIEHWFAECTSVRARTRGAFLEECRRYDAMVGLGYSEQIAEQAACSIGLSPEEIRKLGPLTAWERDELWRGSMSAEAIANVQAVRWWEAAGYSHAQALLAVQSGETAERIRHRAGCYTRARFAGEDSRDFALDPRCDPDDLEGLDLSEAEVDFARRFHPTPETVEAIRSLRNLVESGASEQSEVMQALATAESVDVVRRFESECRWRSIGYKEADLYDVLTAERSDERTWQCARELLGVGLNHTDALRFALTEECGGAFHALAPFTADELAFVARREAAAEGLQDIERLRSAVDERLCAFEEVSAVLMTGATSETVSQFLEFKRWQSRGFPADQAQEAAHRKLNLEAALLNVARYISAGFTEDEARGFSAAGHDPAALDAILPLTQAELQYFARNAPDPKYVTNVQLLRDWYVPEGVAYVLQRDCSLQSRREAARFEKTSGAS